MSVASEGHEEREIEAEEFDEEEFAAVLQGVVSELDESREEAEGIGECCEDLFVARGIRSVVSFDHAGLLCSNAGFVVRMNDGSEFQVSVVRSR